MTDRYTSKHLAIVLALTTFLAGVEAQCTGSVYLTASPNISNFIYSPNYPNPYPSNSICRWLITANEGMVVRLNVSDIDLEPSTGCSYDYITIYDGGSQYGGSLLARLCGLQDIGAQWYSSGRYMYVQFTSDSTNSRKGFQLGYTAVPLSEARFSTTPTPSTQQPCGDQRLIASYYSIGYFTSPNYPSTYPSNSNCRWLITANEGMVVRLFVSAMDLEASTGCSFDYITIYDGASQYEGSQLARICLGIGAQWYSSGRYMSVQFSSDSTNNGKGFRLGYNAVPLSEARFSTTPTPSIQQPCGDQSLIASYYSIGYFTSPNYPSTYPSNSTCEWRITANEGMIVRLFVSYIDLEVNSGCTFDHITVYDGGSQYGGSQLARICQGIGAQWYSSGRYMYVQFTSDYSTNGNGFRLGYKAVLPSEARFSTTPTPSIQQPCGEQILTASYYSTSYFTSPHYLSTYPSNSNCGWRITANEGMVVRLFVSAMDLESNSGCTYDYVTIYDGASQYGGSQLARLCNSQGVGTQWYSSGRYMYVQFISDSTNNGNGFRLGYKAVPLSEVPLTTPGSRYSNICSDNVHTLSALSRFPENIQSPNYPSPYPSDSCISWTIRAIEGSVVYLIVSYLDLEGSYCIYDSLSIYDGDSQNNQMLARLCGTCGRSLQYYSTGSSMLVVFKSDSGVERIGFVLSYQSVLRSQSGQNSVVGSSNCVDSSSGSSYSSSPSSSYEVNVGALIGGVIGSIVLIFFVFTLVLLRRMKRRPLVLRSGAAVNSSIPRSNIIPGSTRPQTSSLFVLAYGERVMASAPTPPAYSNQGYDSLGDAPPAYEYVAFDTSNLQPGEPVPAARGFDPAVSGTEQTEGKELTAEAGAVAASVQPKEGDGSEDPPAYADYMGATNVYAAAWQHE